MNIGRNYTVSKNDTGIPSGMGKGEFRNKVMK